MELSEHELRILHELEEDLKDGSPRLARALGAPGKPGSAVCRLVLGTAGMGIGIGLMVLALAFRSAPMGAVAFAAMTAGAFVASPPRTPFGTRRAHVWNAAHDRKAADQ